MKVYLLRHAIAFDRDPERWPDDQLRPLTREGRQRFRKAARGLRVAAPDVETVLTSPYTRALATAELAAELGRWPAPVLLSSLGASEPIENVVEALRPYSG